MKKKLAILLAMATMGTLAFSATACDELLSFLEMSSTDVSASDSAEDSSSQSPIAVVTVSEAEWKAALEAMKTGTDILAEITSSVNGNNSDGIMKQGKDVVLLSGESNGSPYEIYTVFDGDLLTQTTYTKRDNVWEKRATQCADQAEYKTYKDYSTIAGSTGIGSPVFLTKEGEEKKGLQDMYDAFTFDEEKGVYHAQLLSHVATQNGAPVYADATIDFQFCNGKLTFLSLSLVNETFNTGSQVGVTMLYTAQLSYGITVTVPQDVLDSAVSVD